MARVSSTVTKRIHNPRPRKYASASERQAAYRARAPEVCFRAEQKTVETLDRIAETLDQSRADVLLSMTKFALANHDWARFGLTHKPLPFEYGVNPIMSETLIYGLPRGERERYTEQLLYGGGLKLSKDQIERVKAAASADGWHSFRIVDFDPTAKPDFSKAVKRNPTMKAKRKPTPAQLAARERFAEMARSGGFAKGRKRNPADAAPYTVTWKSTASGRMQTSNYRTKAEAVRDAQSLAAEGAKNVEVSKYSPSTGGVAVEWRKTNPTKKTVSQKISQLTREGYPNRQAVAIALNEERAGKVRRNPAPAKQRMGRIVRVDPKTGVPFGTELVPIDFTFKEWVGNYQQDFFARTEGAQLVVSEKTTGAKVGAVPFTLRSAALNDRAAAKAFVQKTVEKIGADRFNAAIAKAPKLTA